LNTPIVGAIIYQEVMILSNIEWLSDLSILEISFINTYTAESKSYPMKNQGRKHHGFLYTISGTETYNFHDRRLYGEPNSVIYIPKGEEYTIDFSGEKSVVIVIDFEIVSKEKSRPFCIKVNKNTDIKSLFSSSEKSWIKKKPYYSANCKSDFYKIVGMLIRSELTYSNSENYNKISEAVDFLYNNYLNNEFRISQLYEIAHMSPKYFETLFFKEFKCTPKEYIILLKLNQAKELLKNERYSVGEIATLLGYADIFYFSKLFKSKTGYTPTEYRFLDI
jgi:AraC-like DNA-binding protein